MNTIYKVVSKHEDDVYKSALFDLLPPSFVTEYALGEKVTARTGDMFVFDNHIEARTFACGNNSMLGIYPVKRNLTVLECETIHTLKRTTIMVGVSKDNDFRVMRKQLFAFWKRDTHVVSWFDKKKYECSVPKTFFIVKSLIPIKEIEL